MANAPPVSSEYKAALIAGGFTRHSDRGLISVTGNDRATWLNNLITNVIKTLSSGDGNYAFATNVKGRVVFDMNMLVLPDRLWLDIDRRWIEKALAHLNRYIITEDVQLEDNSAKSCRVAVIGSASVDLASRLGFGNLVPMTQLQHVAHDDVRMLRNDFTGLMTAEFISSSESAITQIESAANQSGLAPLSPGCLEVLRIEAGIPRSVEDIDEEVVPPETGQIERGISYHKGCYLGQEVIERMRSHGSLARKLVGLKIEGDSLPARNTPVHSAALEIGRITSACWSETLNAILALGYLKIAYMRDGAQFSVAGQNASLTNLPARK